MPIEIHGIDNDAETWTIGQTFRLISGSPPLTLTGFPPDDDLGVSVLHFSWFVDGKLKNAVLPAASVVCDD